MIVDSGQLWYPFGMIEYDPCVLLSERSESKDLPTFVTQYGQVDAKVPPRAALGRDDMDDS